MGLVSIVLTDLIEIIETVFNNLMLECERTLNNKEHYCKLKALSNLFTLQEIQSFMSTKLQECTYSLRMTDPSA